MHEPPADRPETDLEGRLAVEIEVPRFSFIKRNAQGRVQLIWPLPCPFNYGSVLGTRGDDGDAMDVVVLGDRRPRGARLRVPVRAVVRFVDAGVADPKWICAEAPLTQADVAQISAFFTLYAAVKRALSAVRAPITSERRSTRYDGFSRFG